MALLQTAERRHPAVLNASVARGTPGMRPAPMKADVTSSQLPSGTGATTGSRGGSAGSGGGAVTQPWTSAQSSTANQRT
jgi:hypothetical protein